MKKLLIGLMLLFIASPALAETEPVKALGFTFGASHAEVSKICKLTHRAELKETKSIMYKVEKYSFPLSEVSSSFVFFNENRLWGIVVTSKDNPNDPYGKMAKAEYNQIVTALSKKYECTRSEHFPDYLSNSLFSYALGQGTAWHYTDFKDDNVTGRISISTDPESYNDATLWTLIYRYRPIAKEVDKKEDKDLEKAL